MFENFKLSLWELFVYFITGLLVLAFVFLHIVFHGAATDFFKMVKDVPYSALLSLLFLMGLLLEPIANLSEKLITGKLRKWRKFRSTESEAENYSGMKNLIEKELDPSIKDSGMNTYHLCKDFILQEDLPIPFMSFLSKFGFYRNVAFLFYANAVVTPFVYRCNRISFIFAPLCLILGWFFENRSIDFYGHMTSLVYRNYLIKKKLR